MSIKDKTAVTTVAMSEISRAAAEYFIFERGTTGDGSFNIWAAESTVEGGWTTL